MDFDHYMSEYVEHNGRVALCKLCANNVSTRGESVASSGMLQAHFQKKHIQKDGMHYCNFCCKSICMLGQDIQYENHIESAEHKKHESRIGDEYKVCGDCLSVNPDRLHNPKHTIKTYKYISLADEAEGAPVTVVRNDAKVMKEDQVANIIFSLTASRDHDKVIMRALCNEHFEKVFRFQPHESPIRLKATGDAVCFACKGMAKIWPDCTMNNGVKFCAEEISLRKHGLPLIMKTVELPSEDLSMEEFAALPTESRKQYQYSPASDRFILKKTAVKDQAARHFLTEGTPATAEELLN